VVIRVNVGDKVFVEYLTGPLTDIQGASAELLKEVAKIRKGTRRPNKEGMGMLTRLTSNLKSTFDKNDTSSPRSNVNSNNLTSSMGSPLGASSASVRLTERRKGSVSIPKTPAAHPMFGAPLDAVLARERHTNHGATVPKCVREGISYIFRKGLGVEGIFRLSGAKGEVDNLRASYDHELDVDIFAIRDPNVVASMLKLYLRELPEPLLPIKDYDNYIAAVQLKSEEETVARLVELVESGVSANDRAVLGEFVQLLHCVSGNSKFNKMVAANCSIVLGPNILRKEQVDLNDIRASAALAMDSQDVNKVSEFLINHPHIVVPAGQKPADEERFAMFENKLVGHTKSVLSVARLSEKVLVSVDSSGTALLWDAQNQAHIRTFEIGWRPIGCLTAGGNVWIYGQKGVEVRDAEGKSLFSLNTCPFFCGTFVADQNQVWLGGNPIGVFDASSFERVGEAKVVCELLFSMCHIPNGVHGNEVWGGGLDNSICIYDASDFKLRTTFQTAQKKRINQMVPVKDGSKVYSASEDGIVAVWSTEQRVLLQNIQAHESRCNAITLVGDKVWTAAWDTTIRIFDDSLNLLETLVGFHDDAVFGLVNVDDQKIWSSAGDKGIVIWDVLK
jgi:WD40 repeat protein